MKMELFSEIKAAESKSKPAAERERYLWIASEKYMRGEINGDQLEEIERIHAPNLKKAALALARRNLKRRFVFAITGFKKWFGRNSVATLSDGGL